MRRFKTLISLLVLSGLLVAGCSSGSGPEGPGQSGTMTLEKLIEEAKKEGSLIFYTTATAEPAQLQAEKFTEKYGIQTEMVRLTGSQMDQRVQAEADSSAGLGADIIFTSNPLLVRDMIEKGVLARLDTIGIEGFPFDFPEDFLYEGIGSAAVLVQPTGIAYNTEALQGDDIPKAWDDLIDPKWRGRVGIADPAGSLGYIGEWTVIDEALGGGYLEKLAAQEPVVYPASSTLVGAMAAGEIVMAGAILVSNVMPDKNAGAPVDIVIPDTTSGIELYIGLNPNAQHSAAAKLFAHFVMSQEGAQVLADAANSVSPYDTSKLPSSYIPADMLNAPANLDTVLERLGLK